VKTFLFAVALGCLLAAPAAAQTPATTTNPGQPVILGTTTAPPVVLGSTMPMTTSYAAPAPARRGLFGRLRGRTSAPVMTSPVYSAPLTGGTVITTPTGAPSGAVPMPMPSGTTPPPGGGSSVVVPGATPGVTGTPIILAGGTTGGTVVPAGGVMTASGVVVPAGGVMTPGGTVIPAGAVVTTGGMIVPSSGSMMVMESATTTVPRRMGLIARLRARR
jgi:hypothetical protein